MAEIVRRRSWGGVLPLGRHVSISGSSFIQCASASIAPPHPGGPKSYPGAEYEPVVSPSTTVVVLGERFGRRPDGRGAITTRRSRGPGGCGVGPSASPRAGSPAQTSGSARGPANPALRFFGRRELVRVMAHHGHHGKSQHRQRDVPMPAMPGPRLVVIEPKLGLRRLERILDRPAMPLNRHPSFDPSSGWAPGREERELAIRDAAPDQKPARPQTGLPFGVRAGIEVSQLAIRPVVQPLAFRTVPRGEALPGALLEPCGDRLGGAANGRLVAPGGEPIRGIRAQHIALASPSQPDLDLATPLHGVRGYPTERDAGRKRPLDHL